MKTIEWRAREKEGQKKERTHECHEKISILAIEINNKSAVNKKEDM